MSIITGYLSYTEGSVKVDGMEVLDNPLLVKKKIGYLPEQPPLYMDMTVLEYLNFVYDLKKINNNKKEHLEKVMSMVKISDVKNRVIRNLSKGYKQRVGFAGALIGDPEILILDEPTVGLDPKQIIEIRNVIKSLGKERTIIISSHILQEISAICERVVIINKGKIVAEDTPDNLSKKASVKQQLTMRIAGERGKILSTVEEVTGVLSVKELGVKEEGSIDVIIDVESGLDIRKALFNTLSQKSLPILMLSPNTMSLEDVFITLTKDELKAKKMRERMEK
jgi:ABC-2 type transport system ATP-binding protein